MFLKLSSRVVASLVLLASLLIANIYIYRVAAIHADGLNHIYVLDVGQGDSILVRTASGENILIDGGPTDKVIDWLNLYLPPSDRGLDLVLLTHAHADHATGLLSVVQQFPVAQFWYSGYEYTTDIYNDLLKEVGNRKIPVNFANSGDRFSLMSGQLDILYPFKEHPTNTNPNDASVVSSLHLGTLDILLTGDLGVAGERDIIAAGALTKNEILKVGHQGSHTSSSEEWLRAVDPDIGIISVGADNTYGHPHTDILQRFASIQIPLMRTDQNGTIQVITDGEHYKVVTNR